MKDQSCHISGTLVCEIIVLVKRSSVWKSKHFKVKKCITDLGAVPAAGTAYFCMIFMRVTRFYHQSPTGSGAIPRVMYLFPMHMFLGHVIFVL